ncbi:hypothetical protein [Candidatus Palauibacter sp.]|uniref:hypothetical protein n=1 Tax=Candidatus Palauibacter sp. TaxID=3101350 RepID=UPI003B01E9AC
MACIPTVHETSLDFSFIEALTHYAAPLRFNSGWTIRLDTHYLGGGRHWYGWEVADIGILVLFRRAGTLIRSKIGLFQSKRLYPIEQGFDEDTSIDYMIGFGRLLESDETFLRVTEPRTFSFERASRYKVLSVGDSQWEAIRNYENNYGIPVHYLLYHPLSIPSVAAIPGSPTPTSPGPCHVGARVVPASCVRLGLESKEPNYSPSYADFEFRLPPPFDEPDNTCGWRLEEFITTLLVTCQEGYIAEDPADEGLDRVFNRRAGPISAAISVTFDAPN